MRALTASQAFAISSKGGPRCNARNASALAACSALSMMPSRVAIVPSCQPRAGRSDGQARRIGGDVRRSTLAGLAGWLGLWLVAGGGAADPGSGDALARLTGALAAAEAKEGKTSPYLLPVIEEIAQLRRRNGELGEAAELRRRALDIAVTRFGAGSPSAAEAMVALALIGIERRHYLDAEPLLVVAETVLSERVAADHPAMAAIFAGLARIALARGETAGARASAERAVAIARRNPHGRSTEPLRALGAA